MSDQHVQEAEARIGVALPKAMHAELKILAGQQQKTMQDLAFEAISNLLEKQKAAA